MGVKKHDPDQAYELTTDNVNKILAIHMRFRFVLVIIFKWWYMLGLIDKCKTVEPMTFLTPLLRSYRRNVEAATFALWFSVLTVCSLENTTEYYYGPGKWATSVKHKWFTSGFWNVTTKI